MLEVGWSEMLVIAIVLIVVVGPKDLPRMLRTFGRTTAKLRQMAGDFQRQFNEALQEAELDDVKKSVDTLRDLNPATQIKKHLNPFEKAAADVRAGLQSLNPSAPKPAAAEPRPAEPLKAGASAMPGASPDAPKIEAKIEAKAEATRPKKKTAAPKPASAIATPDKRPAPKGAAAKLPPATTKSERPTKSTARSGNNASASKSKAARTKA